MKSGHICLFLVILLFVDSCAYYATPLTVSDKPDSQTTILFGRLTLEKNNLDGFKMGLWVQDVRSGKPYYLPFLEEDSVFGITAKPGRYRILGFIGSNREHEIKAKCRFPTSQFGGASERTFNVPPGTRTYIGDFRGKATYDGLIVHWAVDSFTNNYSGTATEFCQKFPRFGLSPALSAFRNHD